MDTDEAYRRCEEITWSQARNFAYGIRLLPAGKRRALAAVYAFARRIDDIGDGAMPPADKLAALEEARAAVPGVTRHDGDGTRSHRAGGNGARAGGPARAGGDPAHPAPPDGDPVLIALTDVAERFAVPMSAFGELIDGCVADVRGTRYETFGDLLHYCRCVAGSIGRLSLGVFGASDAEAAAPLADSLGVALQLTNILRDIREDYRAGRVYLPAEDLERFGCTLTPGGPGGPGGPAEPAGEPAPDAGAQASLARLIGFEAARARDWYATGMALLPMLDRRSAACTGAMAGIYARLLGRIAANPAAVLADRLSLSPREKAMVAARSLAGMAYRPRGGPASGGAVAVPPARPQAAGATGSSAHSRSSAAPGSPVPSGSAAPSGSPAVSGAPAASGPTGAGGARGHSSSRPGAAS